ncbi:MAG: hypothetical protein Q8L27_02570, partial [archaeon]|nr:hypothetical protein [archaeon]
NYPTFSETFYEKSYLAPPPLKEIRRFLINTIDNLKLPWAIKSFFALGFGSTLSPGPALFYGLINNSGASFEDFISSNLVLTLAIFHISTILLFFILRKIKIRAPIALLGSLLFLFAISSYSYAYSLYSLIWNVFTSLVWMISWLYLKNQNKSFQKISLLTAALLFFNYFIVFYWAALMMVTVFYPKKEESEENSFKMFLIMFLIILLIAIFVGFMGFAPTRYLLFFSPVIFIILTYGLEDCFKNFNGLKSNLIFIIGILICISLFFVLMSVHLEKTHTNLESINLEGNISAIVIYDGAFEMIYKNWGKNITILDAIPENLKPYREYIYLSQIRSFNETYIEWKNYKDLRILVLEEYSNISNEYFIAYNPEPWRFTHNRPNNLYYARFRVLG